MIVHFQTAGANPQSIGVNPAQVLSIESLPRDTTRINLGHSHDYVVAAPFSEVLRKLDI